MRRLFNNIVSVAFTFVKFCLMKLFLGGGFHFHPIERFSPNVVTEFNRGSHVTLGRAVRVHSGCKLKARPGSTLVIGDNAKFTYNCLITCHDKIVIGEGTEIGPAACLYDHDHDYRAGLTKEKFRTAPIIIGKNCWIAAGSVILCGSTIGDNCVIGAGCIIKGNIPSNTVVTQKRESVLRHYEVTE